MEWLGGSPVKKIECMRLDGSSLTGHVRFLGGSLVKKKNECMRLDGSSLTGHVRLLGGSLVKKKNECMRLDGSSLTGHVRLIEWLGGSPVKKNECICGSMADHLRTKHS